MFPSISILILWLFLFVSIVSAGDSILEEMKRFPEHQRDEKLKEQKANYQLQAFRLRDILRELYFGNHKNVLNNFIQAQNYAKFYFEKYSFMKPIDHQKGLLKIIERDGYYFIEEDHEPQGTFRVLLSNEKKPGNLRTILIPEKDYKKMEENFKQEGIEMTRYYSSKPEKTIYDPIESLLEIDDRYFVRELIERIHKCVERRQKQGTVSKLIQKIF